MIEPDFGEGRVRGWLARHGSPLYVYDVAEVRRSHATFARAFDHANVDFHYAIVCNKNAYLVRELLKLGAGIHANTPGDAYCALRVGVPANRILYSGTNLDRADFEFLLSHGIRMNLDSLDQLRALSRMKRPERFDVGLRFFVAKGASRIGVTKEELPEALAIAREAKIAISGLHMYVGTNTRRVSAFLEGLAELTSASAELPDLSWINIGGGYGIAYETKDFELDVATLGREASRAARELAARVGRPVDLLVEPGRILVGRAGSLYCTVVSVKERGGRRFVGVDSTVGNLVVPSVYHVRHRIESLTPRGPCLEIPTDVCGNTTHSRDFLGRSIHLPALAAGDVLCISDVGAYGYAMSSHFLNRPRPPELVVDGDIEELTTRRETFDDLLHTQNLEHRSATSVEVSS